MALSITTLTVRIPTSTPTLSTHFESEYDTKAQYNLSWPSQLYYILLNTLQQCSSKGTELHPGEQTQEATAGGTHQLLLLSSRLLLQSGFAFLHCPGKHRELKCFLCPVLAEGEISTLECLGVRVSSGLAAEGGLTLLLGSIPAPWLVFCALLGAAHLSLDITALPFSHSHSVTQPQPLLPLKDSHSAADVGKHSFLHKTHSREPTGASTSIPASTAAIPLTHSRTKTCDVFPIHSHPALWPLLTAKCSSIPLDAGSLHAGGSAGETQNCRNHQTTTLNSLGTQFT